MKEVKYEYSPIIEEVFHLTKEKYNNFVIAHYHYGNIVCFDLFNRYKWIHNWCSGYFEDEEGFRKVGTIIRPRYKKFVTKWVEVDKELRPDQIDLKKV